MNTRAPKKEKGLSVPLLKLAEVKGLPPRLYSLVEETAARVGNTDVLAYSINSIMSTYSTNTIGYKIKYEKAQEMLRIAIEDACTLHCSELEISAVHMEMELRRLNVLTTKKSLTEVDDETRAFSRSYVKLASFWRKNGGRNSWRNVPDRLIMKSLIEEHGNEMDRVFAAIKATRSITAPFVAAMDSVPTPLEQGAL